jgi:hypothetical protein
MAKYKAAGREFDLVMSIHAMIEIEKEYGDLKDALTAFRQPGRSVQMIKDIFRILANAGQHKMKKPEDVTGDEIDDLNLAGLNDLSRALDQCMTEAMHAETVNGNEADDEIHDAYAEELAAQEKNA